MKKSIILILILLRGFSSDAQTFVTGPLNQPNTSGAYYNYSSIVLSSGFSSGTNFQAYIQPAPLVNCNSLNLNLSNTQNYLATFTPKKPIKDVYILKNQSSCDVNVDIQYFDGLNRSIQNVLVKGNPNGDRDLVSPIAYDEIGRNPVSYLPYTSSSADGSFKTDALSVNSAYNQSAQYQFYQQQNAGYQNTVFPYAKTVFEASPLNRIKEKGSPGEAWQPASVRNNTTGRTVINNYLTNQNNEVKFWTLTVSGVTSSGNYAEKTLYKSQSMDENWLSGKAGITDQFTDKFGRLVLKRVWESETKSLSTYYIYDLSGNLRYVLPPAINENGLNLSTINETDNAFKEFIYTNKYDDQNRLIIRKLPGKGEEYFVYNNLDQLILTQDANQRLNNKWQFVKYDWQGRVVITGVCTLSGSVDVVQDLANSSAIYWEIRDDSNTTTGYRNTTETYPLLSEISYYLSINYYDTYGWPDYSLVSSNGHSNKTTNQLTGTKVFEAGIDDVNYTRSLNNYTAYFYDDYGRLETAITKNHIGGIDDVVNNYNFANELTNSVYNHTGGQSVTIGMEYKYDHIGRKKQTEQYINNSNQKIILSSLNYNEIGQLSTKKIHSTNNGLGFLNTTTYTYNERDWLKTENNSSAPFNMALRYQDPINGVSPQFNGNISNQLWGTTLGNLQHYYNYNYDPLQRLTSGLSDDGNYEGLSYDLMGNILTLNRKKNGSYIDQLVYTYKNTNQSNQLYSISDNSLSSEGLPINTNYYIFDLNGNAITEGAKGINLKYNYLNLPVSANKGSELTANTWLSNGTKVRKQLPGITQSYFGGIEIVNNTINTIQTEEGRAYPNGNSYVYEYMLKDHLGNIRVLLNQNGTISESTDYFPFGMQIAKSSAASPQNLYKYNGKEFYESSSLKEYDYGSRFYDPVIGRWNVIDKKASLFPSYSSYNFCLGNPTNLIDPDGNAPVGLSLGFNIGARGGYNSNSGWSFNANVSAGVQFNSDYFTATTFAGANLYGGNQLGTSSMTRGLQYDVSAGSYFSIGNSKGDPHNIYFLNYNSPSPFKNTFDTSITWGHFLTYNSAINAKGDGPGIQSQGLFGFRAGNNFSFIYNNDSSMEPTFAGISRKALGLASTDAGWTGSATLNIAGVEFGYQNFSGYRSEEWPGGGIGAKYKQSKYHQSLNKASTYVQANGYRFDYFGAAWMQNYIHNNISHEATYYYDYINRYGVSFGQSNSK